MGLRDAWRALFGPIAPIGATIDPPADDLVGRHLSPSVREDWQRLEATTRQRITAELSESLLAFGGYSDPDLNLTAAQGGSWAFRRLTASRRDLQPLQQLRMLEIAWYLYDSNPQAKRILELPRDYILGDGVHVVASSESESDRLLLQAVIDAFWMDPYNRLDMRTFDRVLELAMFGEIVLTTWVNPVDGMVRFGYVDPAAIQTVLVEPDNEEMPVAVSLVGQAAGGVPAVLASDEKRLKVVRVDLDPTSPSYGRRVGAATDSTGATIERWEDRDQDGKVLRSGTYLGSCLLFQINKVSNARRGRSDLLCLADWVDGFDQMLFGGIDRMLLMKSFVWDVVMEGASQKQIDEYLQANQAPKPGSVRAHNEKIKWDAVSPDLKVADDAAIADMVQSNVATGAGLAKTWLNGALDVNRASAGALSEPAIAHLGARQRYVRYMIEEMVYTALDNFEMAGRLSKRPEQEGSALPVPWDVQINMPELRPRDMASAATTFQAIATGTSSALADDLVDEQVAQDLIAHAAAQLGVEYDMDDMRKRLEEQKAERQKEQEARMALMAARPSASGVPGISGNGTAKAALNGAANDGAKEPVA